MSLNSKIILFLIFIIIVCTAFLAYLILSIKDSGIIKISFLFVFILFVLLTTFLYVIKKHMQSILTQLSEVIASLIDMRESEVFSVLNDDMLSKLQSQVTKLSGILRTQNKKLLDEKNEIKALITDIAHQLKNPLANLNIYSALLLDQNTPQDQIHEYAKNINAQLEKLNWLMESMIKMSRLESGIIQLIPEASSLNDIVLTSLKQVYQKADTKQIQVSFEPEKEVSITIDRRWTVEAITNILDNAVKYTPAGGSITIKLLRYEVFARIDIIDNGMGIEEGEINNIFKRFYRGKNAARVDGIGIGLYLAREIISRQDGYIKVKSQIGTGSTFSVFLPL